MPGTYSKIYIQIVFAVRGRENLLSKNWREELFKYIAGIISEKGHKTLIVGGVSDHVHVFVGLRPAASISDLVRDIKNNSSRFINERGYIKGHFSWQEGYGVFSYSHSQIGTIYNYILRQEVHHNRKTFREEYQSLLDESEINYDERYLFEWYA